MKSQHNAKPTKEFLMAPSSLQVLRGKYNVYPNYKYCWVYRK